MVCDKVNHRIQVFDLSGKFVAKFGTKGSGMGEFNIPVSAAVLSDGKIIVTDFLNHRFNFLNNYDDYAYSGDMFRILTNKMPFRFRIENSGTYFGSQSYGSWQHYLNL